MNDPPKPTFVVNGKEYEMPDDLTLGEMCDAERYFGVEFGTNSDNSTVRMATALLWISVRRQDDTVTIDDIRALPPDVFKSVTKKDDDGPPPLPDAEPSVSSEISGDASQDGGGDPARIPAVTGAPN